FPTRRSSDLFFYPLIFLVMSDVKNQLVDYVKDSFIQQEIMAMKKDLAHKSYDQLMNELLFLEKYWQKWSSAKNRNILSSIQNQIPDSLTHLEREVLTGKIKYLRKYINKSDNKGLEAPLQGVFGVF